MKPFAIKSIVQPSQEKNEDYIRYLERREKYSLLGPRWMRSANATSNATMTFTGFKKSMLQGIHIGYVGAFTTATVDFYQIAFKPQGSSALAERRIVRFCLGSTGNDSIFFDPPLEGIDEKTDIIAYGVGSWPANSQVTLDLYGFEM